MRQGPRIVPGARHPEPDPVPSRPFSDPATGADSAARPPRRAAPGMPVCIVLATRNGAAYLPEQLQSYVDQTHEDWALVASDDGSQDNTQAILDSFAAAHPERDITCVSGPRQGSAANFLSALAIAVQAGPDRALAFSDQDDVWLPDKLTQAVAWFGARPDSARPAAWVCRTVLTDTALRPVGESRHFARPVGFGNALVQNILAGNTIVLNPAAARAVARTVPAALRADVPYHDWWVYLVLSGIGAEIGMEARPLVLYRQHDGNHLGHHGPLVGRLKRFGTVARREYSGWLDANLAALSEVSGAFTPEARRLLKGFRRARQKGGPFLAAALPRLGIYRQTAQGDRLVRMMARTGRL
ncbi:glycosyltransferase [Cognatishimia sp. F0-27]|uniref:glycosyltransferase n=1 Tax=Cognatishimia sp. F0-27 TaxID=2816855 RepID=UPI001D0C9BAB|nr:glycosyltransferase [Cognatishimia sp. F0-27]MCC1494825.1 glycosyltransferase [Cognatishimia sp. F0-27]